MPSPFPLARVRLITAAPYARKGAEGHSPGLEPRQKGTTMTEFDPSRPTHEQSCHSPTSMAQASPGRPAVLPPEMRANFTPAEVLALGNENDRLRSLNEQLRAAVEAAGVPAEITRLEAENSQLRREALELKAVRDELRAVCGAALELIRCAPELNIGGPTAR